MLKHLKCLATVFTCFFRFCHITLHKFPSISMLIYLLGKKISHGIPNSPETFLAAVKANRLLRFHLVCFHRD